MQKLQIPTANIITLAKKFHDSYNFLSQIFHKDSFSSCPFVWPSVKALLHFRINVSPHISKIYEWISIDFMSLTLIKHITVDQILNWHMHFKYSERNVSLIDYFVVAVVTFQQMWVDNTNAPNIDRNCSLWGYGSTTSILCKTVRALLVIQMPTRYKWKEILMNFRINFDWYVNDFQVIVEKNLDHTSRCKLFVNYFYFWLVREWKTTEINLVLMHILPIVKIKKKYSFIS